MVVVSIHEGCNALEPVRDRILWAKGRIRELRADYLLYTILDTVIDNYFPVIEEIGNRLNTIDELLEGGFDKSHERDCRGTLRGLWYRRSWCEDQADLIGKDGRAICLWCAGSAFVVTLVRANRYD